jgi:hypothetical protein
MEHEECHKKWLKLFEKNCDLRDEIAQLKLKLKIFMYK